MNTCEWARHADAIEDMRDSRNTAHVAHAINWAIDSQAMESTDLYAAMATVFWTNGNQGANDACAALEIIMDAYIEAQKRRAAA